MPNALFKLAVAAALAVALVVTLGTAQVQAHEAEENHAHGQSDSQAAGYIPEAYEYIVESGQNQTLLVRRSAQLYDLADDSLTLSPAQLIYVETNVVQEMGAKDLIYPAEMMNVMSKLVAKYASSSQHLSPGVLEAWQVYADNADLAIDDISAENVEVNQDGRVVNPGQNGEDLEFTPDQPEEQPDEHESNDWSVWLVVAGVAAVIWYGFLRAKEPGSK